MSQVAASKEGKSRGGRKSKADWRKNIDIADVEEALEEKREDERENGAPVEERKNADLFTVDIAGDEQTKRRLRQKKKLRVDEILDRRSKVPAAVVGTKLGDERKRKISESKLKRELKKIAGFNGKQRTAPDALKAGSSASSMDIWGAPDNSTSGKNKKKGIVSRQKLAHLAMLPAVEVAHPGASYRPDAKQHKELIDKAGDEYAAVIRRQEKHSEFVNFTGVQPMDGLNECAAIVAQEMMEVDDNADDAAEDDKTIVDGSDESGSEGEEEEEGDASANEDSSAKTKATKRKTRVQRNRQRRVAKEKFEQKMAKAERDLVRKAQHAKRFATIVDKEAAKAEEVVQHKRKLAQEKALKPRERIGKHKVPKLLEAVKLTEELPTSLRQLQPEGSSYAESFNSLMKRNFIEPEVAFKQKVEKVKTRTTEKWSYKDFK
ncbi:hypothetical protein LPJ53_001538 [Coemansia erecta]|uniref:Ribosome biogenesis protein NOP53 n=1 Tax=Coemansia erecta TaxID=147472 RepID=A0A9W7Y684_9FUNG|nr:hypothetical protein LPJ53_001538 [Coemansia erecta]